MSTARSPRVGRMSRHNPPARSPTPPARAQGFFGKVVVDAFDPGVLASTWATHPIDFASANEADLEDIVIPLAFVCKGPGVVHGVACWFDVLFGGTTQQTWLSTAPGMPPTHWFQLRCVLQVRRLL